MTRRGWVVTPIGETDRGDDARPGGGGEPDLRWRRVRAAGMTRRDGDVGVKQA